MIVGDDLRKNPKVTGKPGCLWWLGVLSSGGWIQEEVGSLLVMCLEGCWPDLLEVNKGILEEEGVLGRRRL